MSRLYLDGDEELILTLYRGPILPVFYSMSFFLSQSL